MSDHGMGAVVQVKDPSLLRFLVDLRGADLTDKQLRDDLMTMLIAGHETTAAVLTWALFALMQHPEAQQKAVDEILSVLPDLSVDEISEFTLPADYQAPLPHESGF